MVLIGQIVRDIQGLPPNFGGSGVSFGGAGGRHEVWAYSSCSHLTLM